MNGLEIARELALLGAECAVAAPEDSAIAAHDGFPLHAERWASLGQQMRACLAEASPVASRLRVELGLSEAACWLVLLCAAVEVYPEAAAAISLITEDERVHLPTAASFARLMRSALGVPFVQALAEAAPGGPAERLDLVERAEAAPGRPLTQQPLRLTIGELRRQLHAGSPEPEPAGLALRREAPAPEPGMSAQLVAAAVAMLKESGVLCIRAASARAGRQLAIDVASARGEEAVLVTLPEEGASAAPILKLRVGLPVLDLFAPCSARAFPESFVHGLARALPAVVAVVPWNAATGDLPTLEAGDIDIEARRRIFRGVLGEGAGATRLAQRFRVNVEDVRAAVRAARALALVGPEGPREPDEEAVAREILAQGARRMGRLVTRLESAAQLDHLVIPPGLRRQLEDIIGWHRASTRVFDEWRVGSHTPLGRGLTCLFSGPPGTGKTFAAQCVSNALGLNLYRADLSQVVSKYIGETEKALARIFEEAEAGHGVLLFDEADALFGKRSEVKDAHDRYANVEVGYLLQRLESFAGISILTTNLRDNLDAAFVRRLRFIVEFPMPDAQMRRKLWEMSLPSRERWDRAVELDPFVERFALSGGSIYNIGIAAAHLAAAHPTGVLGVEHLVRATFRELEKAGQARSPGDFGPLAVHLPKGRGG